MCIGVPMQVIDTGCGTALCEGMNGRRRIDTLLVGDQPAGTWLLTFLGSAREVLTSEDAARRSDAVRAINRVMQGDADVSHLFADLVDREPQPPPSMQPIFTKPSSTDPKPET